MTKATVIGLVGLAAVTLACGRRPEAHGEPGAAPVVYLAMEGDLRDLGPYALTARAVGDEVSFAPGIRGQAVFIGGTEDWVEMPMDDRLRFSRGATLELWVRRDDWANPYRAGAGAQTIATLDPLTVDLSIADARDPNQNRIRGLIGTTHGLVRLLSDQQLPALAWTHLALVYDPKLLGVARLYVQGRQVKTVRFVRALTTRYVNPFKLGTWYKSNQAFRGWIDEVKLFDYPRSAEAILAAATR